MNDKYIIKNCPNFDDYFNPNETCQKRYSQYCQDCTDCKIKQVIEKCLDYPNQCKIEGNCIDDRCCTSCFLGGGCELAQEILELFDIQEVE